MRCRNALINKGDSQTKVLENCGEPVSKNSRYVTRAGVTPEKKSGLSINGGAVGGSDRYYPYGKSEVLLEEWTYNFGPDKFMRLVRFANGIVEEVKTLGYGYHPDD